jgi:hypothetical protein
MRNVALSNRLIVGIDVPVARHLGKSMFLKNFRILYWHFQYRRNGVILQLKMKLFLKPNRIGFDLPNPSCRPAPA